MSQADMLQFYCLLKLPLPWQFFISLYLYTVIISACHNKGLLWQRS